ncbi:S41 family peptidase [Candidatus Gottesmanbacteria bacterium]|nr:S41 family peptidase [Candidatus Gottesmanbacteria bacterium]
MSLPFSKIRSFVLIFSLVLLSLGIGYQYGLRNSKAYAPSSNASLTGTASPSTIDFGLFWDVWGRLNRDFIDAKNIDVKKMLYGAINGMVASLDDPYTSFLPPKENKDFKEDIGGAFEGIGAQLGLKESRVMVIAPLKGNPAEKAGIRAGDFILKVNDEDTAGWSVQQAVTKIRGKRGTEVTLNIFHEGAREPVDITITRATIEVPSVESWIKSPSEMTEISKFPDAVRMNGKVAYLRLTRFGDRTDEEWNKAVRDIASALRNGTKGVIFDLRNNPGGYLEGAVYIGSEFISSGVVVTQTNSNGSKMDYPVNRTGTLLSAPIVVLVNKGSASAAEIVAGALRDYKRATIVGETTFGKGSVQTPEELRDGSSLHVTTGKWLLPKGDWIHKKGIKPDIEVKWDGLEATGDAQLAKAVELLLK